MGKKKKPEADEAEVTAEREALNQKSQRTEMGRKRHGADLSAAPKQKTQKLVVFCLLRFLADTVADVQITQVLLFPELQEADLLKRKMMLIWDYENAEIPTELDHSLARQLIIKKLLDAGFSGPVEFHVSVGYLDSRKWTAS